jgi:GNAT superfamily N-acetyltransferase
MYTPRIQNARGTKRDAIMRQAQNEAKRTMKRYLLSPRTHAFLAYDAHNNDPAGFAIWTAPETANAKHHHRRLPLWKRLLGAMVEFYDRLLWLVSRLSLHWVLLYPALGVAVLERQNMWSIHTHRAEKEYISDKHRKQGYWQLSLLGVHPLFTGRGIARRLLKWGMDKADEEDRAVYISASPKGLPVYKKAGFRVIGADLCYPEDHQGGWSETFMVRESESERNHAEKLDE